MTTIVTRVGKGSPLTWTEVDTNFTNLNTAKYESGDTPSFANTIITSSSASDALRITQTGTGNAFVVEDSASPDATPFVIDAAGAVFCGNTSGGGTVTVGSNVSYLTPISALPPGVQTHGTTAGKGFAAYSWQTGVNVGAHLFLLRSNSGIIGQHTIPGNNAQIGNIRSYASDGTNFIEASLISTQVDGTPGTNDMPGRLVFSTTPSGSTTPVERLRIDSAGRLNMQTAMGTGGGTGTASTISGTTLTIGGTVSGFIAVGQRVWGAGVEPNTVITALGTGTGGAGTYIVNNSQTVSSTTISCIESGWNTFRFTDTDTTSSANQPIGQIEWFSSDASTPGAGVKAYITAVSESITPDAALIFGTSDNIADTQAVERMRIGSNGNVSIGGSGSSQVSFYNQKNITGSTIAYANYTVNTVQSDVTSGAYGYRTGIGTAAASFSLTALHHYRATQATFGAGSSVSSQYGFIADDSLIGATNNYGFYSNIASGTGRWNFYANGTAQNYFAGTVGIGVIVPAAKLDIYGIGAGADILQSNNSSAAGTGPTFAQRRDRAGGLVNNGDTLGIYSMSGYDGTSFIRAASIIAAVDGTPGTNDMPGRLVFSTTADGASTPTERTRIGSDGTLRHLNDIAFNNATVLTASYDSVSFSVAGEETNPQDISFRPDGLRMYIIGALGDDITQYTLTTAWDITTAGSPTTFSVASQENSPTAFYFRENGLQFYVVGQTNDIVFEYSCSTAWDITTASYASKSFSVASQETSPSGIFFKPNGLKMYVIGSGADAIYEYDLGTAWDVSTSVYNSVSFSVSGQETSPTGLFFTNDGYKMFVIGSTGDDINEYALSKAWDITTLQFLGVFSVSSQDTAPTGLYIKPDLSKFYIIGTTSDTVYQYSMGASEIDLTSPRINLNGAFNLIGTPPAAATSTGKQGDIIWDSGYIYICVATNTWKRSAITTW